MRKHRDERDSYGPISFDAELEQGETITAVEALEIRDRAGNDVTAEFGDLAEQRDDTSVTFWLNAAAQATHQPPRGKYSVYCRVATSAGRVLVATGKYGRKPAVRIVA